MNAWMVAGPYDLSNATDAEFIFYYWSVTEYAYDYFWTVASTDKEGWWGLRTCGDRVSSCGGWCIYTFDLTDVGDLDTLCGQPKGWIAFASQSDRDKRFKGTYVDDLTLAVMATTTNAPTHTPTAVPIRIWMPLLLH